MRAQTRLAALLLSGLAVSAVHALATVSAWAAGFASAPHTAYYEMSLLETRVGDVTSVDGAMRLEITPACDAWTVSNEMHMRSGNGDGAGVELRVLHKGREATSGEALDFETTVYANGQLTDQIKGSATRDATGRGEAVFDLPEPITLPLPAGTVFPLGALDASIEAFFKQNKRLTNYLYFDGSEAGVDRGTDLVAGTPEPVEADQQDPDNLLTGAPRRIVTTMFDMSQTDAEPRSTYIGDMMPNGILTRLTIDLGFILVEARLSRVSENPLPENC